MTVVAGFMTMAVTMAPLSSSASSIDTMASPSSGAPSTFRRASINRWLPTHAWT